MPTKSPRRLLVSWSAEKLAELAELAKVASSGGHTTESRLAVAQLRAAAGDFDQAEAEVLAVLGQLSTPASLSDEVLVPVLSLLFIVQRLDLAAQILKDRHSPGCDVEILVAEGSPGIRQIICDFLLPDRVRFTFDNSILRGDSTRSAVLGFHWIFPVFVAFAKDFPDGRGSVVFHNWDDAQGPGIAVCSNRSDCFLIPDTVFVPSRAYEWTRRYYDESDVPWEQRRPVAFWRGSTTGHQADRSIGWRSLPRIRLCEAARIRSDLFDVGISAIVQMPDRESEHEVRASGLVRESVPVTEHNRYKYQIDIDGNTNSWSGLFQKLLTGSPVLKVTSASGHRQWYYDRLKPWINFVPVASDMSDLIEKVCWLQAHDDAARAIGGHGRMLARSLDYEGELKFASRTIDAALRYFAGQPESELRFGIGGNGQAQLRAGWFAPHSDGVAARDFESCIELPRPIAPQDFVLSLDISPVTRAAIPVGQRIVVTANGEVLLQAVVPKRQVFRCRLARKTIEAANVLTVILLHPDAVCTASDANPLDDRKLSVVLHELALTPVGARATSGAEAPPVQAPPRPPCGAARPCDPPAPVPVNATLQHERTKSSMLGTSDKQDVPAVAGGTPSGEASDIALALKLSKRIHGTDVFAGFVPTFAEDLQGWNSQFAAFSNLIDEANARVIIDVGVWKGASTIFLAELLRQRRLGGAVIAIDTFLGSAEHWNRDSDMFRLIPRRNGLPLLYEQFMSNIVRRQLQDWVVPLPQTSTAAAHILRSCGIKADVIHIDAAHEYEAVLNDAQMYWNLLNPGGFLTGDDYDATWPGVVKAADEFAARLEIPLRNVPPKWILRKPA